MARSDDLVPYMDPNKVGPQYRKRPGILTSWNPDTGANTVSVAGAVLTNLPVNVNPSDLHEGDIIQVESWGSSWAIAGRTLYPETPEFEDATVQSMANLFQASEDSSFGTRNSNTYGDLTGTGVGPSVTIKIKNSGRAVVFWAAEMGQTANYQITNNPHVAIAVSGANTIAPSNSNALNWHYTFPPTGFLGEAQMQSWIQAANFHLYENLNSGNTTFTMKYRHDTNDPAGAVTFNAREILVIAL